MSVATSGEILCPPPTSVMQTNKEDPKMVTVNSDNSNSAENVGQSEKKTEETLPQPSPGSSPRQNYESRNGQETPPDHEFRKENYHPGFPPENDMASKYYQTFRNISPGLDFKGDKSNDWPKSNFGTYHRDYSAMMSPHHMANFLRPDMYNQEASKLLREMLQSKEKQRYGMDKNQISPLGPDGMIMSKFLQHDSVMFRNGMSDNELSRSPSSQEDSNSENESDAESNIKDGSETVDSINMNDQEKLEEHEISEEADGDSAKVKRARVENIISSIQFSPNKNNNDINMNGQSECKRPKRKQYVPQQHESNYAEEEPSTKQRKVEHGALQEQLKQMQEKLSQMQKCYMALFDQGNPSGPGNNNMIPSHLAAAVNQLKEKFKETEGKESGLSTEAGDLDPSHFIKQASKLVEEQELAARQSGSTPSDIAGLAKMLKDELKSNVNSLVDSVVEKFVQKQKVKSDKETTPAKPSEPVREKPKSPVLLKENTHDRHQLTPKPNRTKVNDKIQPPFFDHRSAFDLPRPHMPQLFMPPPFFSPTQVQPHHFYSKPEPEQTEALPLVVSQPKKKRTKVTDTRLSPRAARALLQEGPPNLNGEEKRHLPPPPPLLEPNRPPIMPMSLPTSVAIPNPSLQHSDVLAMYSREHNMFMEHNPFYSTAPSCLPHHGTDQGSPTIGHTPEGLSMPFKGLDMDSYNDHEGTTVDGFQIISFLLNNNKSTIYRYVNYYYTTKL